MTRIVLVDDHPIVRSGVRMILEAAPRKFEIVGEAGNVAEGIAVLRALRPDFAILDVAMPDRSGQEILRAIIDEGLAVKAIFLTFQESAAMAARLMKMGAWGFVLKRSATQDLVRALDLALRGEKYVEPQISGALLSMPTDELTGRRIALSEREEAVLRLVATGHSNKEISARLQVSVKTIETHRARGCDKLSLHSRADIVRYGRANGWLDEISG